MRMLIQRVLSASVEMVSEPERGIGPGMLVLVGFEDEDTSEDLEWMCNKLINLRIFNDEEGKMNLPITACGGELLIVSQFTLHASTKKGNRPSFIKAAKPGFAIPLYEEFIKLCGGYVPCKTGEFGAYMKVRLINDGPVSIWIDSKQRE